MDSMLEPRPVIDRRDAYETGPSRGTLAYASPYGIPPGEPVKLSTLDIVAGVLMAVMMIGPLAAAAIGRMAT